MKTYFALLAAAIFLAGGSRLQSQTLDWGSTVFSNFADSKGQTLDSIFVFQVGAFTEGFVPQENNVTSWLANWRVFDQASYNQGLGYFTSTAHMLDNGTSDSPYMTSGAPSFEGLTAYLWVRKGDNPVAGSEWLLTRATSWTFPTASPGCCDNQLPVQWSVSDLNGSDVPKWGSQGGVNGSGEATVTGNYTLQTYTFVPEPSSGLLTALAGLIVLMRRRRAGD